MSRVLSATSHQEPRVLFGSPNPNHMQDAFLARARQRHPLVTAARALGYSLCSARQERDQQKNKPKPGVTSKDQAGKDEHKQRERDEAS